MHRIDKYTCSSKDHMEPFHINLAKARCRDMPEEISLNRLQAESRPEWRNLMVGIEGVLEFNLTQCPYFSAEETEAEEGRRY